ncbi:MAG: efflux RND transporter periplasmic adaptor subunit [Pseudomonadota bacterium]
MNEFRDGVIWLAAIVLVAAGGGYLLGRTHENAPAPIQAVSPPAMPAMALKTRTPVYYQDPDGKPDYSSTPKKTADGRDYKPVYDETQTAAASAPALQPAPQGKGKIVYYRNPMGLPDTSPVPKKDSMGMAYIPVYENETGDDAGIVTVSPARIQMLGVRTAPVVMRLALARTIRATGTVQFDERHLATVTTKVAGWVEKLDVASTGESVRAGQALLEFYSPDIVAAEQEYLVVAAMSTGGNGDMMHGDSKLFVDAAVRRLRALDVPEAEIQRLRNTGKAARRIIVPAPANGIVTEKAAVLGMHVDPGTPLYKTADLSSVWLIAQVQEQDLGQVRRGQNAHATFVAFPGRVFDGVVDFIYPTLVSDTRTAQVRIIVPNSDYVLRESLYATVAIDTPASSGEKMTVVPDSAILDSGTAQVVLVARGQGRFQPRAVHIGAHGDGSTQILDGVKPGEKVVVGANFLIDAESNLRAALQAFASGGNKKPSAQPSGVKP